MLNGGLLQHISDAWMGEGHYCVACTMHESTKNEAYQLMSQHPEVRRQLIKAEVARLTGGQLVENDSKSLLCLSLERVILEIAKTVPYNELSNHIKSAEHEGVTSSAAQLRRTHPPDSLPKLKLRLMMKQWLDTIEKPQCPEAKDNNELSPMQGKEASDTEDHQILLLNRISGKKSVLLVVIENPRPKPQNLHTGSKTGLVIRYSAALGRSLVSIPTTAGRVSTIALALKRTLIDCAKSSSIVARPARRTSSKNALT